MAALAQPIPNEMWNILRRLFLTRSGADKTDRRAQGLWGELQAERELKKKGYSILGRRIRVPPRDEIDLLARDNQTLVFVEVKTRSREDFGRPGDAVNRSKRHFLSRAAVRYMMKLREKPDSFRFDVVEIIGTEPAPPKAVRHIENAFPLERSYRV